MGVELDWKKNLLLEPFPVNHKEEKRRSAVKRASDKEDDGSK